MYLQQFSRISLFLAALLMGSLSHAKGLDEVTPEADVPSETGEMAPSEGQQVNSENMSKTSPPATSLPYIVGTGFGLGTLEAEKGETSSSGMADIFVGYRTGVNVAGFTLTALYRYQPISFSLKVDERSMRGVMEGHYFGSLWRYGEGSLTYIFHSEIGILLTSYDDIDGLYQDEVDLEETGFNAVFGGGVDWQMLEKVNLGGRLTVGAGSYTSVQLASSVTFMF